MPPKPAYAPAPVTPSLGEGFFDAATPARFPRHTLRFRNRPWSTRLGLGALDDAAWIDHFARFEPLPGNLERPLALRYHGHQFGVYNAQIGDGRGFLYAQLRDPQTGALLDLGTKGSGKTPYSRGGDGRLTLKGGIREVLATEMLEALGVPTSKSWSLVETGESLMRGDEPSPTRSSVLVRLGHSHVRFGTFQRFAAEGDRARSARLLDFAIAQYHPRLAGAAEGEPKAFFREVARLSATLCAGWMAAGFVHGVLNTDNLSITGESFDYGPWRFLPRHDPGFVAAYFDEGGRYAYGRQPEAVRWGLERLASALDALCPAAELTATLHDFEPRYLRAFHLRFLARLGLCPRDPVSDSLLVSRSLCFLEESRLPFERFFFDWYGGDASATRAGAGPARGLYDGGKWRVVRAAIGEHEPSHPERLAHAYFQDASPCSLVVADVEDLWAPIVDLDDWSVFDAKVAAIRRMGEALGHAAGTEGAPYAADVGDTFR